MKVIIISDPDFIEQEAEAVNALFEEGLETFHLRKPPHGKEQMEKALLSINPKFLKRVVIHSHYELIDRYNLKGIHFPERMLADLSNVNSSVEKLKKRRMTVSASFHSVESVIENKIAFNYVFLSPIFESISKPGYKGNIDLSKLSTYTSTQKRRPEVIALGGIDATKIADIERVKFEGLALLGIIWNDYKKSPDLNLLTEKFKNIIELTKEHAGQA